MTCVQMYRIFMCVGVATTVLYVESAPAPVQAAIRSGFPPNTRLVLSMAAAPL